MNKPLTKTQIESIQQAYLEDELTIQEIAEAFSCSEKTVRRHVSTLPRRIVNQTPEQRAQMLDEIHQMRLAKIPWSDIGARFNRNPKNLTTIYMKEHPAPVTVDEAWWKWKGVRAPKIFRSY